MKPPRLIVRPYTPRQLPYKFNTEQFEEFLTSIFPHLQNIVYAGWMRRVDTSGKKRLGFFIATGKTSQEARTLFKQSHEFGKNIWEIPH